MASPLFADVRAVFFDLDDTLCAYWEAARTGLQQAFEEQGPEGFTAEELAREWAAAFRDFMKVIKHPEWYGEYLKSGEVTRTEQMRRTLARLNIIDEEKAQALSRAYMEARDRNLRLFEDAQPVLDTLKAKYPLGLITNGPADIQRQEIATLGIEGFFETILIEGEMGEGKPNEAVFRRAEKCVAQPPDRILFVGNSYAHDVLPAIHAGWRTAWIRRPTDIPPSAGPGGSAVELKPETAPDPDTTLGNLTELLPLLGL